MQFPMARQPDRKDNGIHSGQNPFHSVRGVSDLGGHWGYAKSPAGVFPCHEPALGLESEVFGAQKNAQRLQEFDHLLRVAWSDKIMLRQVCSGCRPTCLIQIIGGCLEVSFGLLHQASNQVGLVRANVANSDIGFAPHQITYVIRSDHINAQSGRLLLNGAERLRQDEG